MSLELTDLIGPGVALVAVAVGVWQYRLTSLREFIKPVREAQLKLYQEVICRGSDRDASTGIA